MAYGAWGPDTLRMVLAAIEGNPERSGGAAGVPSGRPPSAATTAAMTSNGKSGRKVPPPPNLAADIVLPPSTTFGFKRVKIASAPKGPRGSGAEGGRWRSLARRNPREKLTLTIHYRGGAECWYEVVARGKRGRFPGYIALHDAIREINEGREAWEGEPITYRAPQQHDHSV